jgi:phage-related protein
VIASQIETRSPAISIAAAPVVLALVAILAAIVASRSGGLVRLLAQIVAVILASVAGALAGFLIPLAPLVRQWIGEAFWAGILGTLGTLAGMSLIETLMARLDKR